MNDILKQIDQLVADKTFSLDALEGVKNIRDALIKAESKSEQLQKECDDHIKELTRLRAKIEEEQVKNASLNAKLGAMELTVAAGQEAIYTAQKHEAVANAWKEAMQTVFKPNTVRETVNRSIPIPINPGNGGASYVTTYGETTNVIREDM